MVDSRRLFQNSAYHCGAQFSIVDFSLTCVSLKWFFMEGLLANDDVESTSNLRRIYVESMSNPNLRRIYVESTSNLRRIYVESRPGKTLGRVFEGIKSPCGNGHTHSLGFKNTVFSYVKTLGLFFEAIKNPCGNGHTHSLGFKNTVFRYVKTLGRVLGGHKKPLREWGIPQMGDGYESHFPSPLPLRFA